MLFESRMGMDVPGHHPNPEIPKLALLQLPVFRDLRVGPLS